MNRRTMVVTGVGLGVLAVLAGWRSGRQSAEERITDLEFAVSALNSRVAEIEYVINEAIEEGHGRDLNAEHPDAPADAPNGRFLQVDSISVSDHKVDHSAEIQRLQGEVRSLEQTILNEERHLAQISGESTGSRSSGGNSRKDTRYRAQQSVINNYKRTLSNKQREIERLEAAQLEQKQIIIGRAGEVVITLVTRSDLSSELSDIGPDEYVTWAGKRVSMDRGSETWEVTRVTKIE